MESQAPSSTMRLLFGAAGEDAEVRNEEPVPALEDGEEMFDVEPELDSVDESIKSFGGINFSEVNVELDVRSRGVSKVSSTKRRISFHLDLEKVHHFTQADQEENDPRSTSPTNNEIEISMFRDLPTVTGDDEDEDDEDNDADYHNLQTPRADYVIGGDMSVHAAIREHAPKFEIVRLIVANPQACQARDRDGNIPLHLAAAQSTSLDVFQNLLRFYPQGVKCVNRFNQLPLHRACALNRAVKVVLLLIRAFCSALGNPDNDGNMPIHYASAYNSVFILNLCLKRVKYLFTTAARNREGMLPLHLAALHNSTADNAQALVKCYPYGLNVRTEYNDLPVQLAMKYNIHEEVVRFLARNSPDGLLSNHSIHGLLDVRFCCTPTSKMMFSNPHHFRHRRNFHKGSRQIHICGDTRAGKSVLAALLQKKLAQSSLRRGGRSLFGTNVSGRQVGKGATVGVGASWSCGGWLWSSRGRDLLDALDGSYHVQPQENPSQQHQYQHTEGIDIDRIRFLDRQCSQRIDYTLYDYGGRPEFMVNHARFLSVHDSIYIVVLPLFDVEAMRFYSFEQLSEQLLRWLRLIYSVSGSYDQMSHSDIAGNQSATESSEMPVLSNKKNAFGSNSFVGSTSPKMTRSKSNSRVVPSYDFRLRSFYNNDSMHGEATVSKEVVHVPVMIVLNTFSSYTRPVMTPEEVQVLASRLMDAATSVFRHEEKEKEEDFASRRARFTSTASNFDPQNLEDLLNGSSFRSMGGSKSENTPIGQPINYHINAPVYDRRMQLFDTMVCNVEDKECLNTILPALNSTSNYIFSKGSSGLKSACLFMEKSFDKVPLPVMMKLGNFVQSVRQRLENYPLLGDLHSLPDKMYQEVRDVLVESIITSLRRSGRVVVISARNLPFYDSTTRRATGEDVVLTNPFYVCNNVFNAVLSRLSVQASGIKSFIFSRGEIDEMKRSFSTSRNVRGSSSSLAGGRGSGSMLRGSASKIFTSMSMQDDADVNEDNSLMDDLTASQLLEVNELILPIQYDHVHRVFFCPGRWENKSPRPSPNDTDVIMRPGGRDQERFIVFGLVSEIAPEQILDLFLLKTHTTLLSSSFIISSDCYSLIPGFFMKLFHFIIQADNFKNDFVRFYRDALVVEVYVRKSRPRRPSGQAPSIPDSGSNSASSSLRLEAPGPAISVDTSIVYKKQVIICPVQQAGRTGFQVVVGITPAENIHHRVYMTHLSSAATREAAVAKSPNKDVDTHSHELVHSFIESSQSLNSTSAANVTQFTSYFDENHCRHLQEDYAESAAGKLHHTVVERDIAKIRKFLNTQIWNIELQEVPLHCVRIGEEHFPIVDVEVAAAEAAVGATTKTTTAAGPGSPLGSRYTFDI